MTPSDTSSPYTHNLARLAACTIASHPAQPHRNAAAIAQAAAACHAEGVAAAVFPELALSGYAIDDLLLQDTLLDNVLAALETLRQASAAWRPLLAVGAPLRWRHRLYNCAVLIQRGRVLGVVPKSYLPTYREFHEARHFAAGRGLRGETVTLSGQPVPFGADLLFQAEDLPDFTVGVEICEDLWVPEPPSSRLALAGATVLLNLSASPASVGRAEARAALCRAQSMRALAAYAYTAAGEGESTTDLAWDGQRMIWENGVKLAEGERYGPAGMITADVDLDLLRQERLRMGSFDDGAAELPLHRRIPFTLDPPREDIGLRRAVPRFPFVPAAPDRLAEDCYEAVNIQVAGLAQRLRASGSRRLVIGVSGGLDSTLALLVCARAMDRLGRPRTDILAATLPGFATGPASKGAAHALMRELGVEAREIDIRPLAERMLRDIGHPAAGGAAEYDLTYENVQAGLRTDLLFRLANHHGGLVVGTGDLSELALGWCTYGVGDQMAHYNVNAGVPKTLVQHLIRWTMRHEDLPEAAQTVLAGILAAEITPELVPGGLQGSEAVVGPYELQDFTLYHVLRHGFRPEKIRFLARHAWGDRGRGVWPPGFPEGERREYSHAEIDRWLEVFLRRFGASQFKRSALPNGPKVVAGGALSPRGEWRAPGDGFAGLWAPPGP